MPGSARSKRGTSASSVEPRAKPAAEATPLQAWRLVRRRLSELKLPPDSPRRARGEPGKLDDELDDINDLKSSIAKHGLLVPVLIEPDGTLRAGTRRMRAILELKGKDAEVECIILPPGTDPRVAQLVENIHRKDLTPMEEARGFRALLDRTGWTQTRLASELRLTNERVSRKLNLLRAPPEVQAEVESGRASATAVERAYGRRACPTVPQPPSPRESGEARAQRIRERLESGSPVHARYAETSVRVPTRLLPSNVRARVFLDRVEVTVVLPDEAHTCFGESKTQRKRTMSLSRAIQKVTLQVEERLADALRQARKKVLVIEGEIDP